MDYKAQLDYTRSLAGDYIKSFAYPWRALAGLRDFILSLGRTLPKEYMLLSEGVWAHGSAEIAPTAYIAAPCIIGARSQIRHSAFLRGGVLVGEDCVVGNSTELKGCILFDGVQAPHFNYVGDSILGYKAHLGAGVILSNLRLDRGEVVVRGEEAIPTGLKKFGAVVGDCAEVGCNSVLNPGTIVGRGAKIRPLSCVRGVVEENAVK